MSVADTTRSIQDLLDKLPPDAKIDEAERIALLKVCNRLRSRFETAIETVTDLIFAPHRVSTIRICMGMGLFDVVATSSESQASLESLASQTKADPALLSRLLRVLVHAGLFLEDGPFLYRALPLALLFKSGTPFAAAMIHLEIDTQTVAMLPAYLAERGYTNPSDAFEGPFQYATGSKQHYFEWIGAHHAEQVAFNTVMQLSLRNRGSDWFDIYPVNERLRPLAESATALIVDIGGGVGHDLTGFAIRFGDIPGRLILQDLPSVIDAIPNEPGLPSRIEPIPHDMFQPQPLKGAAVYYLRTVLHDWPDKEATKILRNTADAMDSKSVLLVSEKVMPDVHAPENVVYADISMMVQLAALERTMAQWKALFEDAGLLLTQTWEPKDVSEGGRSLFEARLRT